MILLDAMILPVSQLQTQQVMTSLISVTHRIFDAYLLYYCVYFLLETVEKPTHSGGFTI